MGVSAQDDRAAAAAVAAVGAALGDEFLSAKPDNPVPALAPNHTDLRFVYEHNPSKEKPAEAGSRRRVRESETL
jgi:hypothetical protein